LTSEQRPLNEWALERDAGALFSFVDSICRHCHSAGESPSYLKSSKKFFKYINELGDATKEYLSTFPSKKPNEPRLYQYYRQRLETIRSGWFEIHLLIKSAADADTLNVPYALVEAFTRRLNRVQGFEDTTFAIFHIDELNYWEIPASEIKQTTDKFKRYIPDPPQFPNVGMIGIPYSQSSSLYLNCLIAHEMGHYVFEKREVKEKLLPYIEAALEDVIGKHFEAANDVTLQWSKDRLAAWAEELFCDLFAVWLIGPSYSFAYIELFGLTAILDPTDPSGFSVTTGAGSAIFSAEHPADLLRLKQHVSLLQELGWWGEVDEIKSHYVNVLRSSAKVNQDIFEYRHKEMPLASETIHAFLRLVPQVSIRLADSMKGPGGRKLDTGLASYVKFSACIGQYLERAVVPSTVFQEDEHWYPDDVAILNASMKFYLESLETLMDGIKGQKKFLAGHRSRWIKRVEALAGKAIEDYQLLAGETGAVRIDGSFKRADLRSPESADL
jgi:hypothetical protein